MFYEVIQKIKVARFMDHSLYVRVYMVFHKKGPPFS